MQVSVEATSDLSRKMTVQVPEEKIQEAVATRMKKLAPTTKLAGFRPGKVPHRVLKSKFGGRIRAEVLADLIRSSFDDALKVEKIKMVGTPEITPQETSEGKGLEYVASFEVLPKIPLNMISELQLKRPVCDITEANIDSVIERLREQRKTWSNADRAAQISDRVTTNYQGKAGDVSVTEGLRENFAVVLGSHEMIPGFEDHLVGAEAGAQLKFEVEFPSDYGNNELAGKTAEFDVEVVKVEEGRLADVDETFIKSFGIEDGRMETFRQELKANTEHQISQASQWRLKNTVMNALYEKIVLPSLPEVMVEQEISQMIQSAKEQGVKPEQNVSRDQCEEQAKRRVTLGLIIGEIINANGLTVDQARVDAMIENLAQSSPKPEEVNAWFRSRPEQKRQMEQRVLEDQVVEWVLEHTQLMDEKVSFEELVDAAQHQPAGI